MHYHALSRILRRVQLGGFCRSTWKEKMSLLYQFEQQYSNLTAEITAELGRLNSLPGVNKREIISHVEHQLDDVHELLDQMELAVREIPLGNERQKYENRLKSYKADKEQLVKEFKKARMRQEQVRDDLFAYESGSYVSEDQRVKLLDNSERMERSSRKLQDGYRIAVETEQVGAGILQDLELQRSTLTKTRERLREAEGDLTQSSKVLSGMIQRVIQNRGVLVIVALVFIIIIVLSIYYSTTRKS